MDNNSKLTVFTFFENPGFIYHDFFSGLVGNPYITHGYGDRAIYLYTFIIIACVIVSSLDPWLKGETFVVRIIGISANEIG